MVTKEEALVDLVQRLKTGEFGYDERLNGCVYDKSIGGGCAIGKFLPDNNAADFPEDVTSLFIEYPCYRKYFEDPDSGFWARLQNAHDNFASAFRYNTRKNFVRAIHALRDAGELV